MSAVGLDLDISVEAAEWGDEDALAAPCRSAVAAALAAARVGEPVALAILLTDDEAIREINQEWRDQDKPTNVLSFPAPPVPGHPGPRPLGDVVLARETIAREAQAEGKSFEDHFAHLLVHGTLHCLGYDHDTDEAAAEMEAMEVAALASIGIGDPYRDETDEESAGADAAREER